MVMTFQKARFPKVNDLLYSGMILCEIKVPNNLIKKFKYKL